MVARTVSAAVAFAAAVAVYALVQARDRRLRREAVSQRLMAGCAARDNVALRGQLDVFRLRLSREVTPAAAPSAPAGVPAFPGPSPAPSAAPPAPAAARSVPGLVADAVNPAPCSPIAPSSEGDTP